MELLKNLPQMDMMRSEKMTSVQLIIPVESAHRAISYLGELGLLQFRDLNADKSPFQRIFVNQVKRCAEMSRKLRFFKDQIHKAGLSSSSLPTIQPDIDLERLEIQLANYEHELLEMNANSDQLQQTYNELLEFKMVLQKAGGFLVSSKSHEVMEERELDENVFSHDYQDSVSFLDQEMQSGSSNPSGLRFISGIIVKSKMLLFERTLFRATRGNMFFNQADADEPILDPVSTEMVEKTIFVVYFSGEHSRTKILKICEAFDANCYPVPEDLTKQRQITEEILSRLLDLETTLDAGIRHRNAALHSIGLHLLTWMTMVKREKAVFDTLNMLDFDVTKKCLVGEGWCPIFAKSQIQDALQRATYDSNSQVGIIFHVMEAVESPPTYIRTNQFTYAYQEIIDAYGVAKYQEANPTVFTVITFPFLFAVMFGDWGHGICLLFGALFLITHETKLTSQKLGSFMEMLFGGRYVLLLMSIFSIYCGLIYNEFFSVPFHIFGASAYKCRDTSCSDAYTTGLIKYGDTHQVSVYTTDDLLKQPLWNELFWGQKLLQIMLLVSAIVAVPWMLFPKPFILQKLHFKRFHGGSYNILEASETDMEDHEPDSARRHHVEEFNFSEVFVHQMIHSIEFVLGSVSNTASYLRLWALSLAHSELSTVFYEKILLLAWGYDNVIIRMVGIVVFAFATGFILLMMETLSAFLHALRLHWVEFQNKFYSGDGFKFKPFSFAGIADADDR
ncbi:unnamed protein product [Lactuca virosa]|uniref:V-type proton ATPase subunit a n=1 Tax=Lactuca virosa TaxID=75947 RepID=A0AAU9NWE4_9ASTR|nr:unnamed protein product [Lactuca virosa]